MTVPSKLQQGCMCCDRSDGESAQWPGSGGRQNGGGLLMSPGKEDRRTPPKQKSPGKADGQDSGEEGGLLVVQHGEL